ncbi:MAG: cupredoxin domain-containing protein, partial [Pseudomonas sp.]
MKYHAFVLAVVMTSGMCASAWASSIEGKVTGMKGKSVVYVDTIAGKTFPAPTEKPVMDQKGLLFAPHIMAVQQGTTIEFLNSDTVQHNVFWSAIGSDKKAGHNLGTWPKGEKRAFTFDKPGVVRRLCNVPPDMAGFVVVSPTPDFAETD